MWLKPGATHYEPIEWDAAFQLIADSLKGLKTPEEAIFYYVRTNFKRGRLLVSIVC